MDEIPVFEPPNYWRVVVKFKDDAEIPPGDAGSQLIAERLGPIPGLIVEPLFTSLEPDQILELVKQAQEYDPDYHPPNFQAFFSLVIPGDGDPNKLAALAGELEDVEFAEVEGRLAPPPQVIPDFTSEQNYLAPPDQGVNLTFVRNLARPGREGETIQYADVENGWNFNHIDLATGSGPAATLLPRLGGDNREQFWHGTCVLGILSAQDNTFGILGIAPSARGKLVSIYRSAAATAPNWADAIMAAGYSLNPNEVLLLELQCDKNGVLAPLEVDRATFVAIELIGRSRVIVEAAGNGAQNIDPLLLGDSRAILVGAAISALPHPRTPESNFGARVDCYAWGENVRTTITNAAGNLNDAFTPSFGGTSSASAIIAGVAIVIQSLAEQNQGSRLDPRTMRNILRNSNNGTSSPDLVGVMPDLEKICIQEFGF